MSIALIKNNRKGMTLVEIMIVLAIITLITTIAGPRVLSFLGDAKGKTAKIQISAYKEALDAFYLQNGFYPTSSQGGLTALIQKPSTGKIPENYPDKGYLKKSTIEKDPWGTEYIYESEDQNNYNLYSAGPDGKAGTGDDIKND